MRPFKTHVSFGRPSMAGTNRRVDQIGNSRRCFLFEIAVGSGVGHRSAQRLLADYLREAEIFPPSHFRTRPIFGTQLGRKIESPRRRSRQALDEHYPKSGGLGLGRHATRLEESNPSSPNAAIAKKSKNGLDVALGDRLFTNRFPTNSGEYGHNAAARY
ncbi:hypothetical protein CA13_64200 [Planctomycetes bacterium CA13]|uniref:Uncharacterized protein n=1 Tax=Novipirellula herctigrandis TaxID=2527986 RepID=A0A5C5ZC03_9BACT|nr:hypothetical protein CA13_64200 [Planctomycetes bacterium CA13]